MDLRKELQQAEEELRFAEGSIRTLNKHLGSLASKVDDLKQQIADAEVTYSIGDRFESEHAEYLLAEVGRGDDVFLCMIDLKTGDGHDVPTSFKYGFDTAKISKSDLFKIDEIERNLTRYYDARKQCKVGE